MMDSFVVSCFIFSAFSLTIWVKFSVCLARYSFRTDAISIARVSSRLLVWRWPARPPCHVHVSAIYCLFPVF